MAARDDAPPGAGEATAAREHEARAGGLPEAYGRSRVVLMAVDPFHVHVYWEVTPEDRLRAHNELDPHEPPIWVLRFHDVTCVEFDGTNAHGHFDVPVDLATDNWYVELWSSDKTYFVELGPRSGAGFVAACRSNFEHVPPAEPSPRYEPEWQSVSAAPPPRAAPGDPPEDAAPGQEPAPVTGAEQEAAPVPGAEQEAAPAAGAPAPSRATAEPRVPARPPQPTFARSGRSFSVSLQGKSGSGSAGGPAR